MLVLSRHLKNLSFVPGRIAFHHIAAGTLGILAGYSILVSLRLNVYTKDSVWAILKQYFPVVAVFFAAFVVAGTMWYGS
jgi:photosystem II CP47 chlorophyll apoprotein